MLDQHNLESKHDVTDIVLKYF